jgi:hypothetical protein
MRNNNHNDGTSNDCENNLLDSYCVKKVVQIRQIDCFPSTYDDAASVEHVILMSKITKIDEIEKSISYMFQMKKLLYKQSSPVLFMREKVPHTDKHQ